jgi:hypothetical protein
MDTVVPEACPSLSNSEKRVKLLSLLVILESTQEKLRKLQVVKLGQSMILMAKSFNVDIYVLFSQKHEGVSKSFRTVSIKKQQQQALVEKQHKGLWRQASLC